MRRFFHTVGLLAATLLTAADAPAQDDEPTLRHGIFIDSLDVSLVNVEVVVTRGGEPVRDLTAGDFEIFDDGESVEITNFFRVDGGRRVEAEDPVPSTRSGPAPPEPVVLVVLVDHRFLSPTSRAFVFDQLSDALDRLLDGNTRVMVISKGQSLRVEQPLTSNRAEIRSALDRLSEVPTSDGTSEIRTVLREIEAPRLSDARRAGPGRSSSLPRVSKLDAQRTLRDVERHSRETVVRVRSSLALLRRLAGALAGLPGRKAVIYVADRFPVRSGESAWRLWYEQYGFDHGHELGIPTVDAALDDYDASDLIRQTVADVSASRVAFYPIGAGIASGELDGAEVQGFATRTRFSTRASRPGAGLRWLADDTGGRVRLGRRDVEGFFGELRQDLGHYYSLAYPSPHRGDGEAHRVEVRVDRPDVDVRYLAEYRDKTPDQQLGESTLATLVFGAGDNPLDVRLSLGEPKEQKEGHVLVPVEIRVPIANLVLLPERTAHVGKVVIQLVVRDEQGRFSDPVTMRIPLEVPHRAILRALSETAVYQTELAMRPGVQVLAVGVRDEVGATSSTVRAEIDVGGGG